MALIGPRPISLAVRFPLLACLLTPPSFRLRVPGSEAGRVLSLSNEKKDREKLDEQDRIRRSGKEAVKEREKIKQRKWQKRQGRIRIQRTSRGDGKEVKSERGARTGDTLNYQLRELPSPGY